MTKSPFTTPSVAFGLASFTATASDPPKNLQELYQLFEKYARSEELHQRKVES
jgi:hypothetical protein